MLAVANNSYGEIAFVILAFVVTLIMLIPTLRATRKKATCKYCGGTELTIDKELHWSASTGNLEKAERICTNCHTPIEV